MGMGFGRVEKTYIMITEAKEFLQDSYQEVWWDDGYSREDSPKKYDEYDYPTRVEISNRYTSESSNGSTCYGGTTISIAIYIDGSHLVEEYGAHNEDNPMWNYECSKKMSFLEQLQANTFESPLFKACQGASEEKLTNFFHDLIRKIREDPDNYCNRVYDMATRQWTNRPFDLERTGLDPRCYSCAKCSEHTSQGYVFD